ncbi:hypothetical protein TFKS16_2713 [Tannerella forsythia KS16]|uniref:Uncharacterized protein n=1 Tax=Tannerella forsythia (strain ATCC 43037 / JCM 10827 / CCUG 21028 A / KCTC 5666 / FDC 338) TaxID=203275 RepID=G8UPS1_TANFA|nr:hypothetical protein BFO_2993 [Tannerella forsythia 92A2]BAR50062.1 hypothetical protein TF3313_2633 [Tannerella forsythia 3313]BAR52891.1 hypothetical protein TFKS16_2713 [Tannerella forsythia KS16]
MTPHLLYFYRGEREENSHFFLPLPFRKETVCLKKYSVS